MIGRISLAAVCLLGLAGCNKVVSMEPWFTGADAQGVPEFRDGLWVSVEDVGCRFDVAKPVERWPGCASAMLVRGDEWLEMRWDDPDGDGPRRRTFAGWEASAPSLIANGDPLIGQLELSGDVPDTFREAGEDAEPRWRYGYLAMRPTLGERGDIVAVESWPIACGPLPERAPTGVEGALEDEQSSVTDRPFPGLTIHEDNCTAESVEALRRAATISEPLEPHGTARWVRDGWR